MYARVIKTAKGSRIYLRQKLFKGSWGRNTTPENMRFLSPDPSVAQYYASRGKGGYGNGKRESGGRVWMVSSDSPELPLKRGQFDASKERKYTPKEIEVYQNGPYAIGNVWAGAENDEANLIAGRRLAKHLDFETFIRQYKEAGGGYGGLYDELSKSDLVIGKTKLSNKFNTPSRNEKIFTYDGTNKEIIAALIIEAMADDLDNDYGYNVADYPHMQTFQKAMLDAGLEYLVFRDVLPQNTHPVVEKWPDFDPSLKGKFYAFHGGDRLLFDNERHLQQPWNENNRTSYPTFFTTSPYAATWYAGERGGIFNTAELTINNPADLETLQKTAEDLGRAKDLMNQPHTEDKPNPYKMVLENENVFDWVYDEKVRERLQEMGYDGVAGWDVLGNHSIPAYVPLNHSQIKVFDRTNVANVEPSSAWGEYLTKIPIMTEPGSLGNIRNGRYVVRASRVGFDSPSITVFRIDDGSGRIDKLRTEAIFEPRWNFPEAKSTTAQNEGIPDFMVVPYDNIWEGQESD